MTLNLHRRADITGRRDMLYLSFFQASILSVFALSFIESSYYNELALVISINASDVAYVENLLNLSIAAAYPICVLVMSGEMKRLSERDKIAWRKRLISEDL